MRMLHRTFVLFSCLLFLLNLPVAAAKKLNVVTTIEDAAAITRAIGGERVKVTALAKGYQDPHYIDAKPSYMLLLNRAVLVEIVGLDLEIGYLPGLLEGARNARIQVGQTGHLDLSGVITPLGTKGVADRARGDIHPSGNPHYWLDPENGRLMARAIADRLTLLDPEGQALFRTNLSHFEKTLDEKMVEWSDRSSSFASSPIITYHSSWDYFAARFHLQVVGHVEAKPGVPPSPSHTVELIRLAQSKQVPVILMESFYDQRIPQLIASKTGAKVVAVPNSVGGEKSVVTYFDLFDTIIGALETALEE